jgi:hypothetical protein
LTVLIRTAPISRYNVSVAAVCATGEGTRTYLRVQTKPEQQAVDTPQASSTSSSDGVVVGAVVGSLLALAIVVLVVSSCINSSQTQVSPVFYEYDTIILTINVAAVCFP